MLDIIIKNGWIADGSGSPIYRGDIGIKDGSIRSVGRIPHENGIEIIDANDLIVAPGFIDIHSHDDLYVLENEKTEAKVRQGVTTTIVGNCGFGLFPVVEDNRRLFHEYAASLFGEPETSLFGFESLADLSQALQSKGTVLNVKSLTAHGVIRLAVMGFRPERPTQDEMNHMKSLLRKSMKDGSIGMSLGLIYPPGCYAETDELVQLSKVVSEEGGIVTCHIRNEANLLIESIEEMLYIAKEVQVPLEISHLKTIGSLNTGKAIQAVQLLSKARLEGVDVTFDQYPYTAGSTTLTTLLPPWALEGGINRMLERINNPTNREMIKKDIYEGIPGSVWETMWKLIGWDQIMICSVTCMSNKQYEGKFVHEIVKDTALNPIDFILDLVLEEKGNVMIITFLQDPNEMEQVMTHELQMFGTDGLPMKGKKVHPRLYGTYPRVLGTYVRDKQVLQLEKAINKMTYRPAHRLGLQDRGLILPGMVADITIFNRNTIEDLATYTNPSIYPVGIETVIVNGQIVLHKNHFTSSKPGQFLGLNSNMGGN